MIYIYQKTTGPWICGSDPNLIKKLEPMILVNTTGESVEVRRVVNNSVFIEETNANQIAKNAEGDAYASYAELFQATISLFQQETVAPSETSSKLSKISITGVDEQTDYEMPVDTDMNGWILALNPFEVSATLVEVLGVKKIRFTTALSADENATVIYNKI